LTQADKALSSASMMTLPRFDELVRNYPTRRKVSDQDLIRIIMREQRGGATLDTSAHRVSWALNASGARIYRVGGAFIESGRNPYYGARVEPVSELVTPGNPAAMPIRPVAPATSPLTAPAATRPVFQDSDYYYPSDAVQLGRYLTATYGAPWHYQVPRQRYGSRKTLDTIRGIALLTWDGPFGGMGSSCCADLFEIADGPVFRRAAEGDYFHAAVAPRSIAVWIPPPYASGSERRPGAASLRARPTMSYY
jgi:hypothetical protein